MRYLLFTLLLLSQNGLAQSTLDITVDPIRFQVDATNRLILCQTDLAPYAEIGDSTQVQLLVGNALYPITEKQVGLTYQSSYAVQREEGTYQLFFTQLPIIAIATNFAIVDEPKVLASFQYIDEEQEITSSIGIEVRGGFSQTFPKKTFDLEFWEDDSGENTRDVQFGTMREDDDWILDALYNEPIRVRSLMAHKLWLAMHQPTYQAEEPEAESGADVTWVEVFLQGSYQGVYMLSEQVDRKLLQLRKFKEGQVRGELYEAEDGDEVTMFKDVLPIDSTYRSWGGYEMKYPDGEEATDWTTLHGLVDFVANADALAFREGISERFSIANAIELHLP